MGNDAVSWRTLIRFSSLLKDTLPTAAVSELHHLRRVVKAEHLPCHLQAVSVQSASHSTEISAVSTRTSSPNPTLHLLIAPVTVISREALVDLLGRAPALSAADSRPRILVAPVPLHAPASATQADSWSRRYWPTVYKRNNPFGPQPSILTRAASKMQPGRWMTLATKAATESQTGGLGEAIGAVVVERNISGESVAVFVAGDARWTGLSEVEEGHRGGPGNVAAHAAMRAIGLVARKRRMQRGDADREPRHGIFADEPLTPLEQWHYAQASLTPAGYLCLDLDLYLTHEPCVMCSMALLHSRFGRLVIGRRMPLTGGVVADAGLRHGLFWRRDLHWRLLAWEWLSPDGEDAEGEESGVDPSVHA